MKENRFKRVLREGGRPVGHMIMECGTRGLAMLLKAADVDFYATIRANVAARQAEADRLRKRGEHTFGPKNEMLHALVLQGGLLIAIGAVAGANALLAFVAAAFIGILLLETVNYIEHYGLRRKLTATGSYGRVQHVHSWNSDHLIGRIMLFELTRHSDHHWKASKKYQSLASLEEAPQLPTGYPGTMVLSLVPPLFFRVVHPHLKQLAQDHPELDLAT